MPELPEVETMCRGIASASGCRITNLERPRSKLQSILINPRLPAFARRIKEKTIAAVQRIGKRVVLRLDTGDSIVIEPRMTGLVLLKDPPNEKHIRLVFSLTGGKARQLLFWDQRGLGVVSLLSPKEMSEKLGPKHLGPDALQVSPEVLRERLSRSRRAIKVALLDQHAISGVGNLYASEILHLAAIHPARPCNELKPRHWAAIHAAMLEVLHDAIRHQGSTLRDGTYRAANNEPGGYQHKHRVYHRAGQPCQRCVAQAIVRIVQAQRSTFFCPVCQK